MTVLINKIPPHQRRPIGAIMGRIGVGKTTQLIRAFPSWAFVKTDVSALDSAIDLIASNPELAKEMGLVQEPPVQIDCFNDGASEWLGWLELLCKWVNVTMRARAAKWAALSPEKKKANKHLRLLLAGSNKKLGISIPEPGVPGMILTEATTMWSWASATGKKAHGQGWDTNDRITDVLQVLMSIFQRWNLGLFFDGHIAEAHVERGYPRGFNWPFGAMREGAARPLQIIWELVYNSEDGTGEDAERYFLTQPGYSVDDPLGTIRKTRRHGVPARIELEDKSMADWLKEIRFRVD